ncbi:hypothetical protein ACFO0N_01400 [Halobium salinum]|uniref:Transmembrane protein n=1 Tax=Halobium salinum TaxID=1364940 RepID=A0ABD5P7A5_9EURY|nr:hypothetical protein [Halobium salinum]
MVEPPSPGTGGGRRADGSGSDATGGVGTGEVGVGEVDGVVRLDGVGTVGHCACGVVGLVLTLLALFVGYATVVTVSEAVPLLSTTFIVFATVFVWVALWLALDAALVRVRRPGRPVA